MGSEKGVIYEFGNFRLDAGTDTLWQDKKLISLSPKAFDLLKLLVVNEGNIVSKDTIFETVWKDTFVEEGVLSQNIYTLRNVLGKDKDGNQLIENIKRRGYRITVPIHVLEKIQDIFDSDLNKITSKESVLNETAVQVYEPPKTNSGSNKMLFATIFGIILLSIITFVYFKVFQNQTTEPPNISAYKNLEFQRLTDKGDVNFLNISPDGNWVIYSNNRDIFLRDLNSNSEVVLKIENFDNFGFLQFSNDGNSIFFRSPESSYVPGNIYQTSRFGGAAKLVAENVWGGFRFSPDGKNLAFTRVKPSENKHLLIIKNLENGEEKEFSPKVPPFEYYPRNSPAWSPDGKRIASVVITRTEHFAQLIVTDIGSGAEEEIKTEKFQNVEQILWYAGGKSIVASASDGKNYQLWKIAYPDGKTERITNDPNDYLGLSISADGKKILARQRSYFSNIWIGDGKNPESFQELTQGFARNEGLKGLAWLGNDRIIYTANYEKLRDWNLWSINTSDNSRLQITNDSDTQNEFPAISPDENSIFYSVNRGKPSDIYKIGKNGENSAQITSHENESELFPQISPDGNWLYFIKESENSSAVWRKSLVDAAEEKMTEESELSPTNFLSLSPDGKFLAFQDLTGESNVEKAAKGFRVCVISTENPKEKRFFELPSSQPFAYFSADGKSLEFIKNTNKGAEIFQQPLENNAESKMILTIKTDRIFKAAWSKNGEKLAVSRGKLIRDAVLLTGFE